MNAKEYCDRVYKQLVGLKAGLFDVVQKVDASQDRDRFAGQIDQLSRLVADVDAGLKELQNACPADWSPNRKTIDARMEELRGTLNDLGTKLGVTVPDTLAWV